MQLLEELLIGANSSMKDIKQKLPLPALNVSSKSRKRCLPMPVNIFINVQTVAKFSDPKMGTVVSSVHMQIQNAHLSNLKFT